MPLTLPFVPGRRLVDLINELERRLAGQAPGPGLAADLAEAIPDASSYVFVLFDGLGHPPTRSRRRPLAACLGRGSHGGSLSDHDHGQPRHHLDGAYAGRARDDRSPHAARRRSRERPEVGHPGRCSVDHPTETFLPGPNMWERLRAAGIEPITVQPAEFIHSPLTRAIYRGCRFEGVHGVEEADRSDGGPGAGAGPADVHLLQSGRLRSPRVGPDCQASTGRRSGWWTRHGPSCGRRSSPVWPMVGSADHGHLDYGPGDKLLVSGSGVLRAHVLR
jgi:hypothetical protein